MKRWMQFFAVLFAGSVTGCVSNPNEAGPTENITVPCSTQDSVQACTEQLEALVNKAQSSYDALPDPSQSQAGAWSQVRDEWDKWLTSCAADGEPTVGELSSDCQAGMLKIAVCESRLDPASEHYVTEPSQ